MIKLPQNLVEVQKQVIQVAKKCGLDFYDTVFEMVTYEQMNQIAAYGGFPVRYPHWRFGMEYEQLSKSYQYGLSKIYELVINNDPCYAYLLEGNSFVDQKLVIAHVYGHCDFFKNNMWFSQTNRKMMDVTANHATRIRRYMDRYGVDEVENFIDCCLSLENLIDRYSPYEAISYDLSKTEKEESSNINNKIFSDFRLKTSNPYMDRYINPPEILEREKNKFDQKKKEDQHYSFEKDVLKFLINEAPLESWQQDVLTIIREEAYYFAPQGMTKIMNEGWASYWHSKMMTEHLCTDAEIIDFAQAHSGTMAMSPTGFNPYKVGIELFRDIETRWNKGQFGKEWSECNDVQTKKHWNTRAGKGRERIFEIRRDYNDVTFIDEFLTEEFCVENKMFVYKFDKKTNQFVVDTRNFKAIKQKLLFQLTNFGQPTIHVADSNFENKGELLLSHAFEGIELQPDYMKETLSRLAQIWKRPVNLATVLDEKPHLVKLNEEGFHFKEINTK